jgi:hypothetical protein
MPRTQRHVLAPFHHNIDEDVVERRQASPSEVSIRASRRNAEDQISGSARRPTAIAGPAPRFGAESNSDFEQR